MIYHVLCKLLPDWNRHQLTSVSHQIYLLANLDFCRNQISELLDAFHHLIGLLPPFLLDGLYDIADRSGQGICLGKSPVAFVLDLPLSNPILATQFTDCYAYFRLPHITPMFDLPGLVLTNSGPDK